MNSFNVVPTKFQAKYLQISFIVKFISKDKGAMIKQL